MHYNLRIFHCPNCNKVIDTTMDKCRFCSFPIDKNVAEEAANLHQKVNKACIEGFWTRRLALSMIVCFLLSLVNLLSIILSGILDQTIISIFFSIISIFFSLVFTITIFIVPLLVVRWLVKYRNIKTTDPDFKSAKNATFIALIIWLLFLAPFFLLILPAYINY